MPCATDEISVSLSHQGFMQHKFDYYDARRPRKDGHFYCESRVVSCWTFCRLLLCVLTVLYVCFSEFVVPQFVVSHPCQCVHVLCNIESSTPKRKSNHQKSTILTREEYPRSITTLIEKTYQSCSTVGFSKYINITTGKIYSPTPASIKLQMC